VVARRQISDAEKKIVVERQGLRCFIDNHPVDSAANLEFDHIRPFSERGESEIANIGGVCKKHNRQKGALSLSEYRDRIALQKFFEGANKRRLDDLLAQRLGSGGFGQPLQVERSDGVVKLYFDDGPRESLTAVDDATGESYFYAQMPFKHVRNDGELQPRALEPKRVWELYQHLLTHTQLAPAVARLVGDQVLLFDGQHKAAAQIWAGRRILDCKVYIEPEVRRLKETNLSAHEKFRQMPFYTSTLLEKYAAMATEDWAEFLKRPGPKTEAAFAEFMRGRSNLSKAEAVRRIRSMIYRDVIDHPDNGLREYISEENRTRANPISMARLEKTFFAEFVAPPPLGDEFETDGYHRDEERENLVKLLNTIVTESLRDRWAPERDDAAHKKAARLWSAGALRAWVPFLRDAIAPAVRVFDTEERRRLLYRELSDDDFQRISGLVTRLFSHKVWEDPDPDLHELRYDDAERAKDMLRKNGLTPNWILGGNA
jgi:hypothetical protein